MGKFTIAEISGALAKTMSGATVFSLIQDSIDSPELSLRLIALEKELSTIPEYLAYIAKHNELITKYGRSPDEKDSVAAHQGGMLIDERCSPENIAAYSKEETELLGIEVDRDIKKIQKELLFGQKIRGTLLARIFPFIEA